MSFDNEVEQLYKQLLSVAGRWTSIGTGQRRRYEKQLRKILNEIVRKSVEESNTFPSSFTDHYNELAKAFSGKVSFEVEELTGSPKKFKQMRNRIKKNLLRGSDSVLLSNKQKREFFDSALTAIKQEDIDLFRPRTTLLKIGSKRNQRAEKEIIDLIQRGLDEGISRNQIASKVFNTLETLYPDGKVTFEDKKGRLQSIQIDTYSEMWVDDIQNIVNDQSTIGYMKDAKVDLVRIGGGVTGHICDNWSTPGKNVFSLSGKFPGYKKLDKTPPYHIRCTKYMEPAKENFTEKGLEKNAEIFNRKNFKDANKISKQSSKDKLDAPKYAPVRRKFGT